MDIRLLSSADDLSSWEIFSKTAPEATLWQSPAWKTYQQALGREVRVYAASESEKIHGAALVVIDRTTGGYTTWDIPRGPIGEHREELLQHIIKEVQKEKCLAIFLSPTRSLQATSYKLQPSPRHEQPEATRILDLTLDDNALLKQMKPKGRYNIGVAQKYAIEVEMTKDIDAFYQLLVKTGGRDGFGIGPKSRYTAFLAHIPGAFLLLASHNGTPIAGLLGVIVGTTGIYYYGASDYEHRQMMAPYLLQWHAMQHCRANGCTRYDLLGVAPEGAGDSHAWAGITSFKEKFGGELVSYPPEQMLVLKPLLWRLLQLKRKLWR